MSPLTSTIRNGVGTARAVIVRNNATDAVRGIEMITLKELIQLNETVTLLELYVRQPSGRLIKRAIVGQPYKLSMQQEHDQTDGKLEYLDRNINKQGRPGRNGQTEMAFSMDWKQIPKEYLDAEVTEIHWLRERYGHVSGSVLDCTIVPIQLRLDGMDCPSR